MNRRMKNRRCFTGAATVSLVAFLFGLAAVSLPAEAAPKSVGRKPDRNKKTAGERPLVLINAASVNRLLNDVERTFQAADRPQMFDLVKSFLGNFDNLKGMDRDKPFGLMLFLEAGVPPGITPIGYFPVQNIQDLVKSLSNGPFTIKKKEGKDGRYEIAGPNNSLYFVLKGDYAFVANEENVLDRTLPQPSSFAGTLSKRYDFAVSVNFNAIAADSRELLATALRTSAEAELQQRDGEPDIAYRARRAQGERDIEWLVAVLRHCESILIGIDASPTKEHRAGSLVVEAALEARPKSQLAKMVREIGGKPSYFRALLNEQAPFALSISWGLNKVDRNLLAESLRFLGGRIAYALDPNRTSGLTNPPQKSKPEKTEAPPTGPPSAAKSKKQAAPAQKKQRRRRRRPGFRNRFTRPVRPYEENSPIGRVIAPLIATTKEGRADLFLQFAGEPPEKLVLLFGAYVTDGRQLAGSLPALLRELQKRDNAPAVTLDAESYKGIAFHRIALKRVPRQMQRVFGESPSLLIGASSKEFWAAFGGETAFAELRKAIDKVTDRKEVGREKGTAAPLKMALNVAPWLALSDDNADRPRPGRELARQAFAKGGDGIRLEVRTTENGLRLRARFGEGFLKFLGLAIARQYERRRGI